MNVLLAQGGQPALPPTPSSASPVGQWYDIVIVQWNDMGLELRLGLLGLLIFIGLGIALRLLWPKIRGRTSPHWDTTAIKVKYGDLIEQDIQPNHDTVRIAYQAWVEITTRKIGLVFDEEHDVIEEVYNSCYSLFGVLRGLAKSIPAHRLSHCEDTRQLVHVLQTVLNEGLRPHLTKWQARYRRWYDVAKKKEENCEKTPQEIQQEYPLFNDLVKDLKEINLRFVEFAATLRQLAEGGQER